MAEPDAGAPLSISDRIRGCIFGAFMFLSSLLGSIFILVPIMPTAFISPQLFRHLIDRLVGFWLLIPVGLVRHMFKVKIKVTGDEVDENEPAIFIMNHRSRLDWLFFWNVLYRLNPRLLTTEKILLKKILRLIPGAGWAMGANSYIFLNRDWQKDREKLDEMLDYYSNCGNNYQLLLFPEGTDKCPLATARNRLFCDDKNIKHYQYVLHPKTTGFVFILQKMRKAKYIKYVYDVTIGYPERIIQSELDIIKGACPDIVHFDIHRIDVNTLPADDDQLTSWLIELWRAKDGRLAQYYDTMPQSDRAFVPSGDNALHFPELGSAKEQYIQLSAIAFWLFTTIIWIYLLVVVSVIRAYALICTAMFIVIHYKFGGVEWFVVYLWKLRNGGSLVVDR